MEQQDLNYENEISKKKKWFIPVIISSVIVFALLIIGIIFVCTISAPKVKAQKKIDLGDKYFSDMDYENAVLAYAEAIQIDPKNVDAYVGLADAYIYLADCCLAEGDKKSAINNLKKGIEMLESGEEIIDSDIIPGKSKEMEEKKKEIEDGGTEKEKTATEDIKDETKKEVAEQEKRIAEAYQIYLDYLNNHSDLKIINDWSKNQESTISFCDCYGDECPEMIYCTKSPECYVLNVATIQDGRFTEILKNISFDGIWAGSTHYRLFNIGNTKEIYGICESGDDYWNIDLLHFEEESDGLLHEKNMYSYINKTLYDEGYVYEKAGKTINQSDFDNDVHSLIKDITIIYQCDFFPDDYYGDPYGIENNIINQATIMTYDEAISFLMEQISNNSSENPENEIANDKPGVVFTSEEALELLKHAIADSNEMELKNVTYDMVNEYMGYRMVHTADGHKTVYCINWYIYRIANENAFVTSDGEVIFSTDPEFGKYKNLFDFQIDEWDIGDGFLSDPTFEKGGYGME